MEDAWKQHHELIEKYTQEWLPRPDLRVTGLACERGVRLEIGTRRPVDHPGLGRHDWTGTQRNVSTMRELAEDILAACDFVERNNPVWASRG